MNKVYQHGEELFVTFDATPRLRNLRTGLTLTPRVPFKYLGEMPQVGQVWIGKRTEGLKAVKGFAKGCVQIEFEGSGSTHKGEVPLEIFLQNHTLRPTKGLDFSWIGGVCTEAFEQLGKSIKELVDDGHLTPGAVGSEENEPLVKIPSFIFATGDKDFLNAKATDRRFTVAEVGTDMHKKFEEYMMKDIEAEKQIRDHVGLYMATDGEIYKLVRKLRSKVVLERPNVTLHVGHENFRKFYKALPLPGQLWAKGSRYVTVDRVEDGRVYYTDGSSGLRRFLNEYANVDTYALYKRKTVRATFTGSSPNVQQICKPCHDRKKLEELARGYMGFTPCSEHGVKTTREYGTNLPAPPRPFITAKSAQGKLRELALGYKFGTQGFKLYGQMVGRMLRPAPKTESMPCPLNTSTLNRLNTGDALENWTQYRNTIGAKIRYANQRIKELSKPPAEPLSFSDLIFQRVPEPRFKECAEAALRGFYFDLKSVRMDGDTRMEFRSKEEFIEFCRAVASL